MEIKKVIGAVAVVAVAAGAGAVLGANLFPVTNEVPVITTTIKEVQVPTPFVVEKIVEVPVEVNTVTEVMVDNENLQMVLEHVYDNNGDVEYLIDDLDDDELSKVVDRIVFVNDVKSMAVQFVKSEIVDEMDKENVNGTVIDEDDVERLKVDDDSDKVVIDSIDFEDKDASVVVTGSFEQDDVDFDFSCLVKFKDGKVDDLKNVEIRKA